MNNLQEKVLLIGELTTESIVNELKILDKVYINKLLSSSPDNWRDAKQKTREYFTCFYEVD
ncbi:hypothetical protein CA600_28600 [Paenibacillus sp. VTT E-133280]|uniref:hypothetical protein n=1 Tax=unclassified Paenibacillus TaxID=185978 RepID=UPI000B9FA765|nr:MULTISPECIES: hypothetical protein [unclassified Paenibacillus]MBY3621373.1 hypothetical protein [Acinetobacter sp. CUI P1]MDH6373017.1 hypothetical protein [Paenibacillus sp. PastF-3]OZQ60353.1 hypothetical protein CA600_28600 [Paenibacillus sp. VTT E-133280]OZQ85102.1 hypothetical protein CA598_21950 [Paenibacillus sp. VTT E-133291]